MNLPTMTPFTITSRDSNFTLTLSSAAVTMQLSEEALAEARGEIKQEMETYQGEGTINRFVRFVLNAAHKIVSGRIECPLSEIKSALYQDNSIVFTYRKKPRISFDMISIGSHETKALASFSSTDATEFVSRVQAALHT